MFFENITPSTLVKKALSLSTVNSVKAKHPEKAEGCISEMFLGINILVKLVQLLKAPLSIETTLSGRDNSIKALHPRKAEEPMVVIPSGRLTSDKLLQLSKVDHSIAVIPLGRVILDKFIQFRKAPPPD